MSYKCVACGKVVSSRNALANHLNKVSDHGGDDWKESVEKARKADRLEASEESDDEPEGENPDDPTVGNVDEIIEQMEDPECPECGGTNLFDPSQYYPQYEYGCRDCSDSDSWVVFNE